MLNIQRITTADTTLYAYMEKLIVASFPPEEYRELKALRSYTDTRPNFHNNVILQDETPIGIITYWDFGSFCYIEHFAIDPNLRNGGYGKEVLNHLCKLLQRPIVLEVEMPEEEMAQRRIRFYQRQGFTLWERPYLQPPYKAGDDFLPMRIMAYGDIDCEKEFDNVKKRIYREVYSALAD